MASTPVSPKVTTGAATAAIVGLLLQYANTLTPDMFAFLGKGQGLTFLVVTLALSGLAAWWKTDPLRVPPAVTTSTPDVPAPSALVAPSVSVPADEPVTETPAVLLVHP